MSYTGDPDHHRCDGCGTDVGNASTLLAATISAMNSDGAPVLLQVGYSCGCAGRLLFNPAALPDANRRGISLKLRSLEVVS